ncbi:MAG: GNAT family N-acetyltransferase [bacterium]
MSPTLQISPATEADLPGLVALYRHLSPADPPPPPERAMDSFRRFLMYRDSAILIGTLGTAPVASCTLVVIPNLTRSATPYALIENVVTHADHRNRGHGKALLNAATRRAWAAGCYKVMLLTGSQDPATLHFYAAAGFAQTKTGFQIRLPVPTV